MDILKEFFHIQLNHLPKDMQVFPFNIYVYNSMGDTYSTFLYANSPLTKDKRAFLKYISEKGGEISISKKQKRTFLKSTNVESSEIPSLNIKDLHALEKAQIMYHKLYEQKCEKEEFIFDEEFSKALQNDDFSKIIEWARAEILTFGPRISSTVSLAVHFAETLLTKDNLTNKIVALSFFIAKTSNLKDISTLGELVCASFLHHIGHTQLDWSLTRKSYLELSDKEKKDYKKHAGLSHHLIRKSKAQISDRCIAAINQHHERADGSGYPFQKKIEHIEFLGLIIGASSHILEYSSGLITGQKIPLQNVLKKLKNKDFDAGLEFEFGDRIYDILSNLISETSYNNMNKIKKAA